MSDINAAPPAALAKMPKSREILVELKSLIDGKRSISDIRDAVSAEFGNVPLPLVVEYFEIHTQAGTITLR